MKFMSHLSLIALLAGSFAYGEIVTRGQCDSGYDKCKKKPEHIFDKKPCRKERDACFLKVASGKQESTKNRMLGGDKRELSAREAAEQRMRERNGETGGASMRDRVSSDGEVVRVEYKSDAQKKAEAQRRLKARQSAKNAKEGANKMRESLN